MQEKKIVVVGSCNTDMVIKADRLPIPGETVLGGTFFMNPGGKGANQAVAAARMGGNVTLISKTGNDVFGKQSMMLYDSENIKTDYIFSDPNNPSGVALITVDSNGENCIVVASGANANLFPADIDKAYAEIENCDLVLMQLEIPIDTVEYVAEIASKKNIKVILNPAPARALSDNLLKNLYIIIPNRSEAEILSGIKVTDLEKARQAADIISAKGVNIVVVTLGSEGALIKEFDKYHYIEAVKVDAMDTTAAGDVFCGSVCVGLAEGRSIIDSVKMAARAAAITVTRMGAQSSIPYRSELSSLD
ncbi:MAG: ribokinase [Bacteroidetes bacterium HGW-Bacteroidetes-1]|jgi:ribokinase|nr:MAG: ribokinase [Bacteroidetes bacterium HGW-Bacteroidetes-1]